MDNLKDIRFYLVVFSIAGLCGYMVSGLKKIKSETTHQSQARKAEFVDAIQTMTVGKNSRKNIHPALLNNPHFIKNSTLMGPLPQ